MAEPSVALRVVPPEPGRLVRACVLGARPVDPSMRAWNHSWESRKRIAFAHISSRPPWRIVCRDKRFAGLPEQRDWGRLSGRSGAGATTPFFVCAGAKVEVREEVRQLAEPLAEEHGYELVDIEQASLGH